MDALLEQLESLEEEWEDDEPPARVYDLADRIRQLVERGTAPGSYELAVTYSYIDGETSMAVGWWVSGMAAELIPDDPVRTVFGGGERTHTFQFTDPVKLLGLARYFYLAEDIFQGVTGTVVQLNGEEITR